MVLPDGELILPTDKKLLSGDQWFKSLEKSVPSSELTHSIRTPFDSTASIIIPPHDCAVNAIDPAGPTHF